MTVQLDKPLESASSEASWYDAAGDMLANKLPDAVKGFGFAKPGGTKPLDNSEEIFDRSFKAASALKASVRRSHSDPQSVVKGLNPSFRSQFGLFDSAVGAPGFGGGGQGFSEFVQQVQGALGELGKNITIGSGPLFSSTFGTAGFVPYDLVNPARLVYPVFSPLRNKLPRVPGQGTSRQAKIVTGISGSQTGGMGVVDISSAETTTFTSWNAIPPAGSQQAVNISVPYRFMALSESLSWLAQFSGQGFEDISSLANLILLQEFMLGEEYAIIAGTSSNLSTPSTPTLALRTAGSNETALPASTHFWVTVTATNYYGETAMATVTADLGAVASTQVVDVTIPAVSGALQYNVYVNNQSATTPARTAMYRFASNIGGVKFTLQGPSVPNSGTNPPAADTGTGGSNRIEGLVPTLSGFSATTAGVYPTTGANSVQWQGGYVNQAAGTHLSINLLNTAFQQLWDGTGATNPGAFRADPSEIIGEGGDIMRLSNDVVQAGAATNYRLFIEQPDVSGIRAGAAVSEFQNPITRSVVKLLVHPWLTQGTAMLMSYTVPYAWSQVSNIWEMTMVQDYLSISWPVIDPTFRYSMFAFGALVANAPWYCGLLQGLQKTDTTPYS
jgi:hypothetical protein